MSKKKETVRKNVVGEPVVSYQKEVLKQESNNQDTFNFDEELKKGLTPTEFKDEMLKRIKTYSW
ncbi:hypothetical protein HNP99_000240 [Flavobacterium sp. 28A]|uniref:hypothetical protein n=1 Tax=Flavobacterium sp. 28A TaxID=2735895 RepID=UPI00156E380C|nr:hypothetical protein [Flavobacterium sp. 28A]NRT13915.1 hypothetical protein [Flavobacterium sp. 28A]